jgi:AraC family transcriptional regulator
MHADGSSSHTVPGHGVIRDEVRVDGIRVVDVSHAAALCLGVHAHDTAKIAILLEGGCTERAAIDVLAATVLDPVFRPAGKPHANQYHALGARALLVELDPDDARVRAAADGLARDRRARELAVHLAAAFGARRSSRTRLVRATVHALLRILQARALPACPAWLDGARETLAARFVEPPTVAELARAAGVHPVYLVQSFRARWGMTTRAFVRSHRVFHAVQLVEQGTTLAEAAAAAGFADQSHMTRAIRRERGAPPGRLLGAPP